MTGFSGEFILLGKFRIVTTQRWRVSKAAFSDSKDGSPTSVSLQSVLILSGLAVTYPLQGFENYCLAAVSVQVARGLRLGVQRDPEPHDPSHALLFGRKTEGVRKSLANNSAWVVAPTAPLPDEMA